SVQPFGSNGFMLRIGGEISNFTTGITPRYCARMIGCGFCAEGLGCAEAFPKANSPSVIAAKQSKTATKTRSLKNPPSPGVRRTGGDWEEDFFFMRWSWTKWWLLLRRRRVSTQFSLFIASEVRNPPSPGLRRTEWTALLAKCAEMCQHNFIFNHAWLSPR